MQSVWCIAVITENSQGKDGDSGGELSVKSFAFPAASPSTKSLDRAKHNRQHQRDLQIYHCLGTGKQDKDCSSAGRKCA